jgi:hypothetical protein
MTHVPDWLIQAYLVAWIVVSGVAHVTGTSPVCGLSGTIIVATSILARGLIRKAS